MKTLLAKYNANPADPTITDNERLMLARIQETGKKLVNIEQQLEALQKEINQKTQQMQELRATGIKEQGRQEAFVDAILAMRVQ